MRSHTIQATAASRTMQQGLWENHRGSESLLLHPIFCRSLVESIEHSDKLNRTALLLRPGPFLFFFFAEKCWFEWREMRREFDSQRMINGSRFISVLVVSRFWFIYLLFVIYSFLHWHGRCYTGIGMRVIISRWWMVEYKAESFSNFT